jgi:hypothetical protein
MQHADYVLQYDASHESWEELAHYRQVQHGIQQCFQAQCPAILHTTWNIIIAWAARRNISKRLLRAHGTRSTPQNG